MQYQPAVAVDWSRYLAKWPTVRRSCGCHDNAYSDTTLDHDTTWHTTSTETHTGKPRRAHVDSHESETSVWGAHINGIVCSTEQEIHACHMPKRLQVRRCVRWKARHVWDKDIATACTYHSNHSHNNSNNAKGNLRPRLATNIRNSQVHQLMFIIRTPT